MCGHYMAAAVTCQGDIGHLFASADARMAVATILCTTGVSSTAACLGTGASAVSTDRALFPPRAAWLLE